MHRTVVGRFDGGKFSSDAGGLLLRKGEQRCHILKRLAECFIDHQNAALIEHSLESLVNQRAMSLTLGHDSPMITMDCVVTPCGPCLVTLGNHLFICRMI